MTTDSRPTPEKSGIYIDGGKEKTMLKFKLYAVSVDNGKTYTDYYLTDREANEYTERFCYIVTGREIPWDTEKIMDEILRRYEQIRNTQNTANANDFLQEVKTELEKLLEDKP